MGSQFSLSKSQHQGAGKRRSRSQHSEKRQRRRHDGPGPGPSPHHTEPTQPGDVASTFPSSAQLQSSSSLNPIKPTATIRNSTGVSDSGVVATQTPDPAPSGLVPIAFSDSSNSGSQQSYIRMTGTPATVPCQYRTGKTLGSGTYAIVKEAVQIKTGKYYACKVINKKLMQGREYMVRNEIAVLKKVSSGHQNIVTLRDYFETSHNLYLVFDLCTGGELFDRICAKGSYFEADAAQLVRTIMKAVKYIHDCGIVHRDLKPENLLFRTPAEEADIMIADFGLSRVMEEEKLQLLTEICGTPGYMAPEIFKKTGHSKPVDVWAMGVITYFLLCGYTPFDRDTQQEEMEAIMAGDFKFEPAEYWANVSETAKSFVTECLTIDPGNRPTAEEALKHLWLSEQGEHYVESPTGGPTNLLPHIQKAFDARKTFRKAVLGMMAMKRMSTLAHHNTAFHELRTNLNLYKEESEQEIVDEDREVIHVHHHESNEIDHLKREDDISEDHEGPVKELSHMSLSASDEKEDAEEKKKSK